MLLGVQGRCRDSNRVLRGYEDAGAHDPLLVTSDGAPGIIKAIEVCFPRAARQRCLAHRMRNLAAKVPEDIWPDFKARVQAAYQAPSRAIARELAAGIIDDYGQEQERGVACFMDDFEACIAHLRFPVTHRRAIRTTNLLERLFVEERRRLKIIPNAFGERAVLKLMRCKAEESKLRTAQRLANLISVFCILSWRVFWMTMLNRSAPDAPPNVALTDIEIGLDHLVKDKAKARSDKSRCPIT